MRKLTEAVRLERWANMYTLARSIPRDRRFDMDSWGEYNNKSACGTTACLGGHAVLHPWFRRRGFNKVEFKEGSMNIDLEDIHKFWGYDHNPFYQDNSPTPKQAAKYLKQWMVDYWGKSKVEAAISKATATYDAKWVHKYTPWDCPSKD